MKNRSHPILLVVAAFVATLCSAQVEPHIGYVYPASIQAGTTTEIVVGGRGLGGLKKLLLGNVAAEMEIVSHTNRVDRCYQAYLRELGKVYRKAKGKVAPEVWDALREEAAAITEIKVGNRPVPVPDNPRFRHLRELSLKEFRAVAEKFRRAERVQENRELSEALVLRLTVPSATPPGPCELRLYGQRSVSNPMRFIIGSTAETNEREPNDQTATQTHDATRPLLLNGQILPGDVDRFAIRARKGQRLVLQLKARELIPFLADAVPGWFQATLRVLGPDGEELAFVDDYTFRPDPVVYFEVPQTGRYEIEVRDSIYRGREDFVYRLSIDEAPFVTSLHPLVAQADSEVEAAVEGWNLKQSRLKLDTGATQLGRRHVRLVAGDSVSNAVAYWVTESAVISEEGQGQGIPRLRVGETFAGRFSDPGEIDSLVFAGDAGQGIEVEVIARRLGSPVDSRLTLFGPSGEPLATSDNSPQLNKGVATDHADSRIGLVLPESGDYRIQIEDALGRGGEAFAYALRLGEARPDFELFVYPSGINIAPGSSKVLNVKIDRRNGFDGPVELILGPDSEGFRLSGNLVPAGQDHAQFVLTAPKESAVQSLQWSGVAKIDGRSVRRSAQACEPMTQAFITHHYLDTDGFLAVVSGRRQPLPRWKRPADSRLTFEETNRCELVLLKPINLPKRLIGMDFELSEGFALAGVQEEDDRYRLEITRDSELCPTEGWVLVQCFARFQGKAKEGRAPKERRTFAGALPAIPYQSKPLGI